jgi:K+-transporting ATPase KdpF subunit
VGQASNLPEHMDYLIAACAAALLFGYLVVALLRPERF